MYNEIKQKIKSRHSENRYRIPYIYLGSTPKTMTIKDTQFTYRHYEVFLGSTSYSNAYDMSLIKRLTGENPNIITKMEDHFFVTEANTQIKYLIEGMFNTWAQIFFDLIKKEELSLKTLTHMVNRLNKKSKYKAYYKTKKRDKEIEKSSKVAKIEEEKNQNMLNREFGK